MNVIGVIFSAMFCWLSRTALLRDEIQASAGFGLLAFGCLCLATWYDIWWHENLRRKNGGTRNEIQSDNADC